MAQQEAYLFDERMQNMPYSLEAEQSVLGSLLLSPECMPEVLEYVTRAEMFYLKQHQGLFGVLLRMFTENRSIDFVTVLDELGTTDTFESTEAAKVYLVQLMELVPTLANLSDYCRIVQEKYYLRRLMTACNEILARAAQGDGDAMGLLALAEQRIYDIRQGKDAAALTKIDAVIIEAYTRLTKLAGADKEEYQGLRTGYRYLDRLIGGLNKSDLILVAARPGMGKSSFALNIAVNVAKRYDKEVAVFSLEMSNEQVVTRSLSAQARVLNEKLRVGNLTPQEWVELANGADVLSRTNIYMDDSAGITIAQMNAKLRRLRNLGLVVIDYLQLMSSERPTQNRVQEISQMTRALKVMAKELNVPVILLSQLSRAAEQREGHRPMLSDLRDSGSIEQDADIVLFLYREDYYSKENTETNKEDALCIVAKNRHGSTGDVSLRWLGEYTLFEDVEFNREG